METIKLPQKERVYMTEAEVMKVADAIDNYLIKLIVLFLFNTGVRISECRDLKIEDVDLENRFIYVIEGKNMKDRVVPINNSLYELLVDYIGNHRDAPKSNYFFATRKSGTGSISYLRFNSSNIIICTSYEFSLCEAHFDMWYNLVVLVTV